MTNNQVDRSLGFDTAVERAQGPLIAAKVEASSALRGIGLVKVRVVGCEGVRV